MVFNDTLISSILNMKRRYSWAEIATALNEDHQTTFTGEAIRKRVQRYKRNFPMKYLSIRLWNKILYMINLSS